MLVSPAVAALKTQAQAPLRSLDQRMEALKRANDIRVRRAPRIVVHALHGCLQTEVSHCEYIWLSVPM